MEQVLYYIAKNLSARADEFAARIQSATGVDGAAEVEHALDRLFTYAAWADKYDGAVKDVPIRGIALAMNAPVGVIGVLAFDHAPLLGITLAFAPAIALGNRVVWWRGKAHRWWPLCLKLAGVVNIITGDNVTLGASLAGHIDIDALWNFSTADIAVQTEQLSASDATRLVFAAKPRTRVFESRQRRQKDMAALWRLEMSQFAKDCRLQ